jgi:hypothetical protein
MGENAARDAVERFGLQRQADDFLSWYQEILMGWPLQSQEKSSMPCPTVCEQQL